MNIFDRMPLRVFARKLERNQLIGVAVVVEKEHLFTILYIHSLNLYTCSPRFEAALTDPFIPDMI